MGQHATALRATTGALHELLSLSLSRIHKYTYIHTRVALPRFHFHLLSPSTVMRPFSKNAFVFAHSPPPSGTLTRGSSMDLFIARFIRPVLTGFFLAPTKCLHCASLPFPFDLHSYVIAVINFCSNNLCSYCRFEPEHLHCVAVSIPPPDLLLNNRVVSITAPFLGLSSHTRFPHIIFGLYNPLDRGRSFLYSYKKLPLVLFLARSFPSLSKTALLKPLFVDPSFAYF